jgi:two-component system response regulator FixJ
MNARVNLALVDDDPVFLFEFAQKLSQYNLTVRSFREASALIDNLDTVASFDCIVADVRMPGMSGLDLQNRLNTALMRIPLILITGYADIDIAVSAMKAGAHDFISKPIDAGRLAASIETAVAQMRRRLLDEREQAAVALRVAELSERHRQVLDLMVRGFTSKQIGAALDINHRTVENYRAFVMERIGASNIAQLVRVMMRLEQTKPSATGGEATANVPKPAPQRRA